MGYPYPPSLYLTGEVLLLRGDPPPSGRTHTSILSGGVPCLYPLWRSVARPYFTEKLCFHSSQEHHASILHREAARLDPPLRNIVPLSSMEKCRTSVLQVVASCIQCQWSVIMALQQANLNGEAACGCGMAARVKNPHRAVIIIAHRFLWPGGGPHGQN